MEYLKKYGCEFKVIDMALGEGLKEIIKTIRYFKPGIVGVSMLTYGYKNSYRIFERIKEFCPSALILCGGPHISTFREKALLECKAIDYGFVRDGEETLAEFCQGRNPLGIPRLIFRNGSSSVCYTGEKDAIDNLDEIPWPKYEGIDLNRYISNVKILIFN